MRWSMADAAAGSERTPHKFQYTSALEVPKVALLEGNTVLQGTVLTELKYRIREVEAFKIQVDLLKAENFRKGVQIVTLSHRPSINTLMGCGKAGVGRPIGRNDIWIGCYGGRWSTTHERSLQSNDRKPTINYRPII
jgi:hypothetical protein